LCAQTNLGRSIAWSAEQIGNIPTFEIARGNESLRVNFTYATEFSLANLSAYIQGRTGNSTEIIQGMLFLNQVIADSLTRSQSITVMGRKYFSTEESEIDIMRINDHSLLEFRRGFYQAVHWGGTSGLTINVNVTTGIFWNSQMHTVMDLALRSIGLRATEGRSLSSLDEPQFHTITRNLRGLKFYIKYRGASREGQLHLITGVSKDSARNKMFDSQGERTSVADYFLNTYNVRLKYPDAPLVRKGDNLFPMEVCYVAPVSHFTTHNLNERCNVTPKNSTASKPPR